MLHLDFSGGQAVKTALSQHGTGVRSLVREFSTGHEVWPERKKEKCCPR